MSDPRPCVDCGVQITRKSLRCKACAYTRTLQRGKARAKAVATPTPSELHTCVECCGVYETTRPSQRYCSAECRDRVRYRRGYGTSTTSRGYGREHQKVRAQWRTVVEAGEATCCLCSDPIHPSEAWHLDHTPERDGYRGAAHARCNVVDGGRRGGLATRGAGVGRE